VQERASAEELFQLGKAAMARQDYAKACPYLQASLEAEFAMGTLLNLAVCHEESGKIASAWAEFHTLEDKARRATPPQVDRAQFAKEHQEALYPRVSRLRIVLSPAVKTTGGLVVKIDGATVAPELFDVGMPVDLGKRKVTATAPEHEEWSQVVAVDDERLKLEVTVPELRPGKSKSAHPVVDLAEVERISAVRSQRAIGFIVGGIGVAALGTGAVFGVLAVSASNDARCAAPCFKDSGAFRSANDSFDRMNTFGWVSNIGIAAGLIALGVGTYLVLTAKPPRAGSGSASLLRAHF
jgi:hypothetical protein